MNSLLAITADFFEHLTNPAFGRETNDGYDFKFHVLMRNDASTAQQLATAPLSRDDVGSMSAAAWLWYLEWRESTTAELPSGDFLDALYDEAANPVLRLRIVKLSVREMQHGQTGADSVADTENMRLAWIQNRIRNFTGEDDSSRQGIGLQRESVEDAWELLSYLIDIGTSESLGAARPLLAGRGQDAQALRERALELVTQMQLSDEENSRFRSQLGLQQ
jgi:hypothetical protein